MRYREVDLHYIFVRVNSKTKSLADLTGREFTNWVTTKINKNQLNREKYFPIKTTFLKDRVNVIEKLRKDNIKIIMVRRKVRHKFEKND